jgi:hypothetical protein
MYRFSVVFLLLCFAAVLSAPVAAQAPVTQTPAAQPAPVQTPAPQAPATPSPAAQPKPVAPACTYSSKAYGDGAFVCVEKSLMLKCTVDEAKASWSVVTDKDLSDKCRAPVRETIYQQRARWNRRNIAREITAPTDTSSRCFNFTGKRYCE